MVATLCALSLQSALFLLDAKLYDIGLSGKAATSPEDIQILGLDEAFMRGRHPYLAPRDQLASLLTLIARNGHPTAIVLDVWLDSHLEAQQDAQLRASFAQLRANGIPLLLADLSGADLGETGDASQSGSTVHGRALPEFREAATSNASVAFLPDLDRVVRRMSPGSGLIPMPLLAARTHAQALAKKGEDAQWSDLEARLSREAVPIDFCGPPGTIAQMPAVKLLNLQRTAPPLVLKAVVTPLCQDKLVFIGSTYIRGRDTLQTPYSFRKDHADWNQMFGVELLAQATYTLLQGGPRQSDSTPGAMGFTALLTFFLALLVAALGVRGTRRAVLTAVLALLGSALIAVLSARDAGLLWGFRYHPASPIWIAVPLACAAAIAWREWHEARELHHVRGAFEAYVGPQVLRQLSGKMPELGGEVRPVTVLFCDIRGYSALAESMRDDPVGLLRELNGHFSPLVGALQARHAHVDNYVGDLIMALWCEPLSGHNPQRNARDAVAAALEIERLVRERNEKRGAQGLPPIEVGIGVHCGEAVVGNLGGQTGTDSKIHYTAIGDTVNLASRVENATRQFDVPLLVTRQITEEIGEAAGFRWEFVAQTAVKNRQQTVDVFRVHEAQA